MSPLWRDTTDLQHLGQTGCAVAVGNGQDTAFWTNRWIGECSLASSFPYRFHLCTDLDVTVFEVALSAGQVLHFNKQLTRVLLLGFNELCVLREVFC